MVAGFEIENYVSVEILEKLYSVVVTSLIMKFGKAIVKLIAIHSLSNWFIETLTFDVAKFAVL
jgi:hypothetical protein